MDGNEVEPIITNEKYDTRNKNYLNRIKSVNRKRFKVKLTRGGKLEKKT